MEKELRMALTKEERGEWSDTVAITFAVSPDGKIIVGEEWEANDEIYGPGCHVSIPPRIWAEGLKWIADRQPA